MKKPNPSQKKQQTGMALLTVLLLVVMISVIAGSILTNQKILIRQSQLTFNQDQLLHDLKAGEQFALELLRTDASLNQSDSTNDIWAKPIPPYPLGNHMIDLNIQDESAHFNINNLYHDGAVDKNSLEYLKRLLYKLDLNSDLATAILDWQDPDEIVYNDTAEEGRAYQQNLPNRPFLNLDELANVEGITPEILQTLRPYLTCVPYFLPLNVNTADAVLLSALAEDLSENQFESFVKNRQNQTLDDLEMFWQMPVFATLTADQKLTVEPLLAIDSGAFSVLVTAYDGEQRRRFATLLIQKNGDHVKVIWRRLWAFKPVYFV